MLRINARPRVRSAVAEHGPREADVYKRQGLIPTLVCVNGIRIGRHTLIGADALILDNDMHYPRSGARWGSTPVSYTHLGRFWTPI